MITGFKSKVLNTEQLDKPPSMSSARGSGYIFFLVTALSGGNQHKIVAIHPFFLLKPPLNSKGVQTAR